MENQIKNKNLDKDSDLDKLKVNENIKKIKFPDLTLLETFHQQEFDLDWKIPEALVIKYSINDSQIAVGYTDGHLIIYNINENNDQVKF